MKSFFENVLGVQAIYSETTKTKVFRVHIEDFSNYSPEENELFEKILGAIGLDRSSIQIFSDLHSQNECDLYFLNAPSDDSKVVSSPRAMLVNPGLKKLAWEKLKKILVF